MGLSFTPLILFAVVRLIFCSITTVHFFKVAPTRAYDFDVPWRLNKNALQVQGGVDLRQTVSARSQGVLPASIGIGLRCTIFRKPFRYTAKSSQTFAIFYNYGTELYVMKQCKMNSEATLNNSSLAYYLMFLCRNHCAIRSQASIFKTFWSYLAADTFATD